jgi:D-alanyl-D-alanine carboxypeptidase/D-alanyl-D-alanine-endopeptidase (penicillin-binding protein 4)
LAGLIYNTIVMESAMKRILLGFTIWLLLVGCSLADIGKRINGIIAQPGVKDVEFSINVIEAATGKNVYNHNARLAMIPASNMKLVTSAAALKYLGSDYEFVTKIGLCGDTLIVVGGGDPLLGDAATDERYGKEAGWMFSDIADELKAKGVKSVNDIVVDSSIFDDERVHPSWPKDQLNRWYACEVAGVNYNGNCVAITARKAGSRVVLSIDPETSFIKMVNDPETSFIKMVNKVTATTSGSSVIGSYRNGAVNSLRVFGKCAKEAGPIDVAIERPAALFGYILAEHLVSVGIKPKGELLEKSVGVNCKLKILRQYKHTMGDIRWVTVLLGAIRIVSDLPLRRCLKVLLPRLMVVKTGVGNVAGGLSVVI